MLGCVTPRSPCRPGLGPALRLDVDVRGDHKISFGLQDGGLIKRVRDLIPSRGKLFSGNGH